MGQQDSRDDVSLPSASKMPPGAGEAAETPLPARLMFAIWLTQLFQGIQMTLPYTLAVYMVRSFSDTGSDERVVGQLTGILAACSAAARSLTSFPWGLLSDRVGRKPVVVAGNLAGAFGLPAFGLAGSYPAALAARFVAGLFNGAPVAVKSMLGESCDATNQARAMSYLTLGHGMGTIIGPALGGVLAEPCGRFAQMPGCGEGGLLQARPYLLPCLVTGALGLAAAAANMAFMDETLPSRRRTGGAGKGYGRLVDEEHVGQPASSGKQATDVELSQLQAQPGDVRPAGSPGAERPPGQVVGASAAGGSAEGPAATRGGGLAQAGDDAAPAESVRAGGHGAARQPNPSPSVSGSDSEDEQAALLASTSHSAPHRGFSPGSSSGRAQGSPAGCRTPQCRQHQHQLVSEDEDTLGGTAAESPPADAPKWYRARTVQLALAGATLIALVFNFLDELTPIYVSAPRGAGGLALPMAALAAPLSFGGAVLVAYSLALYPRFQKAVGPLRACQAGLAGALPATLLIPAASAVPASGIGAQALLWVAMGIRSVAKVQALTSSMILVNLVAPRSEMGAVNGAQMTLASAARAIGPAASGAVWALTVTLGFAGHQWLGFVACAAACIGSLALYSHRDLRQLNSRS